MEKENTDELHFYPPKFKNSLVFLGIVGLTILCIILFFDGLEYDRTKNMIGGVVGTLLTIPAGWLFARRALFTSKSHVILTKRELIYNNLSKHPIIIKRKDIIGYEIVSMNYIDYIDLALDNKEVYRTQLAKMNEDRNIIVRTLSTTSRLTFNLSLVKPKDRQQLLDKLDKDVARDVSDRYYDELSHVNSYEDARVYEQDDPLEVEDNSNPPVRISGIYMLKGLGFSVILSIVAYVLFYRIDMGGISWWFIVAQTLLYPFARALYDSLIGFRFNEKFNRQAVQFVVFYQFRYMIYLVVYMLSVFLGPIGIIYLLIRRIIRE